MVLIKVGGSSLNPCDSDWVQNLPGCHYNSDGTPGGDVAGEIVGLGAGISRFELGDHVWANRFELGGGMAEYAVALENETGLMPSALSFLEAGTIPTVGETALQCLQCLQPPARGQNNSCGRLGSLENLTVAITSGSGGTGYLAIQMARALGAAKVIVAASSSSIPWMYALGADLVIDYKKQDLFSALDDDSVDAVFDNFAGEGTADKAMPKLRKGGVFLLLPHGGCLGKLSDHPKIGVRQINFGDVNQRNHSTLDLMASWFDTGKLKINRGNVPGVQTIYSFEDANAAFKVVASGHVHGKLAITSHVNRSGSALLV